MPGLSQLQQFNKDLLAIGDEITIRAARGEKPVTFPIPKEIEDINDSEDFVLGMPENEAAADESSVDEDLSDITGLINPTANSTSSNDEAPAPSFEAPDMSSLLNPVIAPSDSGSEADMPDLSMFDEPVEEEPEEEPVEEEPEEVSVADMNLEDLLASSGFDEPEESEEENFEENEPEPEPAISNDFQDISDVDSIGTTDDFSADLPDDFGSDLPQMSDSIDSFDMPEMPESAEGTDSFDMPESSDNLDSFDMPEMPESTDNFDSFDMPEMPESAEGTDSFDMPESSDNLDSFDMPEMPEAPESTDSTDSLDSFDMPEMPESAEGTDSFDMPESSDNFDSFDMPEMPETPESPESPESSDLSESDDFSNTSLDDFSADLPDDFGADTMEQDSEDLSGDIPAGLFDAGDMDMANAGGITDSLDSMDSIDSMGENPSGETAEPTEEIPDFDDGENVDSFDEVDSSDVLETFDTSEMDGMDFGIPDTDSQLGDHDFELGESDEFAMEGDFEIPGFSDVSDAQEAEEEKKKGKKGKGKGKDVDEADFSKAIPSEELPPNTLTDEQYQEFLTNLHNYPLNVRLAFEDLIVQDEFTDDAEFEVIEKILNKAPARNVASMLEKMLDISLPVPRDYENRTAEEYEAYKKSLAYQLRNKIIPGILIGIVCLFVAWGLFNFSKNCIYKPLKAISLYKQGYALLEEDEYPQSEMKFNEATGYRLNKKWFFNYARGYRNHKQYQRADAIYQRILRDFKHDKAAGLEYADMQLNDLANYERAEEIVRREILDYHINDEEGILKLGDVFLEWGTEKDPAKLELAREQYSILMQLYGTNDLYSSRMMRYYIRSDNLRQVLQNKTRFEGKGREKSLSADDWTELSGYLLQKSYGPLAPSEEYLRYQIEGLRKMLITAVEANNKNPIALYNLSKYYILSSETNLIEPALKNCIEMFNQAKMLKRRDFYKYIDSYRLLGEYYIDSTDYLQAQEQFVEGISLYTAERDNAGFTGNQDIGKLYEDLGNINYFVSGEYDEALFNYMNSVELENDTPSIRYKIGYIQYNKQNFTEALGSFMKAGDGNIKERNLMLAMANTLSLRGDDYAAEGYYDQLIANLDDEIAEKGIVLPQSKASDNEIVTTYLHAANNYGVTLYRLARRTGDSSKNGEAIVQFSQSVRAWDALTRNQSTLVRLGGSNLAEMNIQYVTHPMPDYEPTIYTDIEKTLTDKEKL